MAGPFHHRLFGLNVLSDLECPELPPGTGTTDVVVRLAPPWTDTAAGLEARPGRVVWRVPRAGRFVVEDGNAISIEAHEGVDEDTLRLLLLGTPVGALLHQRRVLPLQGAAVCRDGRSVLLIGAAGAGKSSVAAALRRHGWRLQSDDICAVRLEGGVAVCEPGVPRRRLWPDTLIALGDDPDAHPRLRPDLEVRHVSVGDSDFHDGAAPITSVVLIAPGRAAVPELTPIEGTRGMVLLRHHTFRANLPVALGVHPSQFSTIARVATQARLWRLQRPRSGGSPADVADVLAAQLTT